MGFQPISVLPTQQKKSKSSTKKPTGFKSAQKIPASQRKRPLEDEMIYGDELFATSHRKEKEIVVCFHPFTLNGLRISTDGKFAIEYITGIKDEEGNEEFFSLFYLGQTPITDFDPEKNKIYDLSGRLENKCIEKTPRLQEIEDKVIECVKLEYAAEKKQKLEELIAVEEEAKANREKEDELEDAKLAKENENNVVDEGSITELADNSNSEINNETTESEKDTTLPPEAGKVDEGEGNKIAEAVKPRGFSSI